jgi:hypothetical protein
VFTFELVKVRQIISRIQWISVYWGRSVQGVGDGHTLKMLLSVPGVLNATAP